jgi:hypothetical protein
MAVIRKTLNFLPNIFRSETNKKFLGSTLDQLVSEPSFTRTDGFIGRKFSVTFRQSDNYVQEPTTNRTNYQLEPGLIAKNNSGDIDFYADYIDIINNITNNNGIANNHDRLFESEYYSFDPRIDLDKFVNYSQYYWLPNGPETVTISTLVSTTSNVITVTGNAASSAYTINTAANPTIRLNRGVTYAFTVNHPGSSFWIQTEPGIIGTKKYASATSSRRVQGVTNNGTSSGTVTFAVPTETVQDFYFGMKLIDYVDYAISDTFTSVDGSNYTLGVTAFDGNNDYPKGRFVIFLNPSSNSADWTTRTGSIVPTNQRRGVYQININHNNQVELTFVRSLPATPRVQVQLGATQAGEEYTVTSDQFVMIDPITAPVTKLFYQNSVNSALCGEIEIIDTPLQIINVTANIIGQTSYTSPTGVVLTNGMKVFFDNTVTPSQYQNKTYIVEGVGTAIRLIDFNKLIGVEVENPFESVPFDTVNYDMDLFDGDVRTSFGHDYITINRSSLDLNAWSRSNRWFHIDVIKSSAAYNNRVPVIDQSSRAQRPIIEFDPDLRLFNMSRIGVDLVDQFFSPGTVLNVNGQAIVLNDIAQINLLPITTVKNYGINLQIGQKVVFACDLDSTVRRSIYRVDTVDQSALLTYDGILAGTIELKYQKRLVNGFMTSFLTELVPGADIYLEDMTYIGKVEQIYSNTQLLLDRAPTQNYNSVCCIRYNIPKIVLTSLDVLESYESVTVLIGDNAKKTFYLTASLVWTQAQQKNLLNQEPLFDVINSAGQSFSSTIAYPNSLFTGTKLFSYKRGTTSNDPVLGFPVSYAGIENSTGDLNFVNNFETDQFTHTVSNIINDEVSKKIYTGFLEKITGRTTYGKINVWNKVDRATRQYQHLSSIFDGVTSYYEIGVVPAAESVTVGSETSLRVYINNNLLIKSRPGQSDAYSYQLVGTRKTIRIDPTLLSADDKIDIFVYSNEVSDFGYYTIPQNLEYNGQNLPISLITLGQVRNHFYKIGETAKGFLGLASASSNLRDINTDTLAGTLLQHSSPLTVTGLFSNDRQANFYHSINFARKEYTRFKNKFLELASVLPEAASGDVSTIVDLIMSNINQVKDSSFPWYYSDMVPSGKNYKSIIYSITNPSTKIYNITTAFADSVPSSKSILVYLNGIQLIKTKDYTFSTSPVVIIDTSVTLSLNDILEIREYINTNGNYVPETPTKLGIYPKFQPVRYLDNTYRTPTYVIQGHDGSLIPAFNDFRDNLVLELEYRIYNNIKTEYSRNQFDILAQIPGNFRTTDYSLSEFNQILNVEFLKWVGSNQVDYITNNYFVGNDSFTYNYNKSVTDNNQYLPGFWRGIYKFYFDTDRPHSHPWEMLGFTVKPTWWDTYYSWTNPTKRAALILAISNGYINDPAQPVSINTVYARPGFNQIVPVDNSGNLLSPMTILVRNYNSTTFGNNFSVGDHGPVESAWRRSSEYPYALHRTMALMKPARYFGLLYDISSYKLDSSLTYPQFRNINLSKRLATTEYPIPSDTVRTAGYINWIHGYLTSQGYQSSDLIESKLANLEINLTHRLAGFSDKKFLTVIAEQQSTATNQRSIIIPDENYSINLNKSVPITTVVYSAVIIERTDTGFTVSGFDTSFPYFTIIPSEVTGKSYTVEVLDHRGVIYLDFKLEKLTVPYGFEFVTEQQVVDFLISYQRYLLGQGWIFDNYSSDLGYNQDWVLSAREFLTWASQGWKSENILVVSPVGDTISFYNDESVVDNIDGQTGRLLGVNFNVIRRSEFSITRDGLLTKIFTISGQSIAFAELNLVQFEHVLCFDNVTVFNDIVYKPELGSRKSRLKLAGVKTAQWDGQLTPPGFIYSSGKIDEWTAGVDYKKGDIVLYKNKNYTATQNQIASDSFNYNYWTLLDSTITQELIPNFSYGASRSTDYYDIDNSPVDEEFAKFSRGLIGYRSRSYLANLGMSETTQSKFYQGYIRQKGTRNAVDALARARFDGLENNIEIYEEWGARVGEYGAIDSNPAIQIILEESVFNNNPLIFELLDNNNTGQGTESRKLLPYDLLSRPENYKSDIFLNRNVIPDTVYKIELFGDSIMCGRDPAYAGASLTCVADQITGRVNNPPDFLIYSNLDSAYKVAVTTRSSQNSTSGNLLAGSDGVNGAWPDDIEADIVVINHGLMDAKNGVTLTAYKNNLIALRQKLRPEQTCLWVTPTPISSATGAAWTSAGGYSNISDYVNTMKSVARLYNDYIVDAYSLTGYTDTLGADGLHPTQAGYNLYVNNGIVPEIKKIISNHQRTFIKDYEDDIKSAGYVNQADVNGLIFDIAQLDQVASDIVSNLSTGYKIWIAKYFNKDWQVIRAYKNVASVTFIDLDLDQKIIVTTDIAHNLEIADVIAIKNARDDIDGFYQVFDVTDTTIVLVAPAAVIANLVDNPVVDITGEIYDFVTLRFATISDGLRNTPRHGWLDTDLAWIDRVNDATASWAVFGITDIVNSVINWKLVRSAEPKVDLNSINNLYLYSQKTKKILTRLDIFDPAKGRVLGVVAADIDYTGSVDPAQYNSKITDNTLSVDNQVAWGQKQLGQYWWNIDQCRFIDYEQHTIDYRVSNWGKLFPGSSIHVYEWIVSDYLPSEHVELGLDGVPLYAENQAYSVANYVDPDTNAITTRYFYWVRSRKNKFIVDKINSSYSLENMIMSPAAQGIPYVAALKSNAIALYNAGQYLVDMDTVLYVSYQNQVNDRIIHTDFKLVQDGNEQSLIPERIEKKIIDSLVGADAVMNIVPDQALNAYERLGIGIRPRQTLLVNRLKAVENVIKYVNSVLREYPAAGRLINNDLINSDNFYALDPEPATTEYNNRVTSYANLLSQISSPSANQLVLVAADETNDNYWVLYRRNSSNSQWVAVKRQSFNVPLLWSFTDWYANGYDYTVQPNFTVRTPMELYKLPIGNGTIVKILNTDQEIISGTYRGVEETPGNFEIYKFTYENNRLKWNLIGLQNGTFQIKDLFYQSQGFDSDPYDTSYYDYNFFIELRYVLAGLKQDVFIADLAVNYNKLMFFVIDYILSEQTYIDWFFKTSLVTVLHKISGLQQDPGFINDRQSYYENYIQEVKPYRTKIRQYILNYSEIELPRLAVTDFDLPAYYDQNLKIFRSPNGDLSTVDTAKFSEAAYQDWYNNHTYTIGSLDIAWPGYGYYDCHNGGAEPDIAIVRTDTNTGVNAEYTTRLSGLNSISKVDLETTGNNYITTPLVSVIGNGATPISDRAIYEFRVSSTGTNESNASISFGLYSISSASMLYSTVTNGYTMHRIRRTDGVVEFSRGYNIPNQTTANYAGFTGSDLASDLGATTKDYIVVVHTSGNPEPYRLQTDLLEAMYSCGASDEIYNSATVFKTGGAYVLVGIPGSGKGNGLENYAGSTNNSTDAACWVEFKLRSGMLIPTAAFPRAEYFSTTVTRSLPGDKPPHYAVVVPRMTNTTVRKIRTVIRFDRTQYTSVVKDWTPVGYDTNKFDYSGTDFIDPFDKGYKAGSVLSYQGQAYRLTRDMYSRYYTEGSANVAVVPGNKFEFAATNVIGADQDPSSRTYMHGYFNNANDRIMAYYQPTGLMTPKELARLVPGIDPAQTVIGNTTIGVDTILVGDTFSSVVGISPGNIKVNGGSFVSNIFSHAPEELMPGQTFDSLTMRVTVNNSIASTNVTGVPYVANISTTSFGLYKDLNGNVQYFTYGSATTTLAQPLSLTDANIYVSNGSLLAVPNPGAIVPGIVMINGERIQYYVKDGNRLSQLRRGINITGAALVHPVGSRVDDVSSAVVVNVIKV